MPVPSFEANDPADHRDRRISGFNTRGRLQQLEEG